MSGCGACSTSWPRMRPHARRPAVLDAAAGRRSTADGPERCLLYVGGHCSLVPHLRRHAETRRLELLHHDGGEEHSLHVLEGLVGRAEAVFCPIDCVSHQACLAAKQLCRRLDEAVRAVAHRQRHLLPARDRPLARRRRAGPVAEAGATAARLAPAAPAGE